jgi:hypothetical protein
MVDSSRQTSARLGPSTPVAGDRRGTVFGRLSRLKARSERLARSSRYASIRDGKQDALIHLIGSALFTREYGAALAWLASQVAEFGAWAVGHNSAAQRDMDRHNNKVGRAIARRAESEEEIVKLACRAIEDRIAQWLADGEKAEPPLPS